MPTILLIIPALEILSGLGFIYLASNSTVSGLRYLPVLIAAVAVLFLFARVAGSMTLRQIAVTALTLTFLATAAVQGIGLVFSGFAKDIELISVENLARLSVIFIIGLILHGGLLALFHFLRR